MNNSTVNFTPEASTNSTTHSIAQLNSLNICLFGLPFLVGVPTHSYVIWLIITGTGRGVASEFFNLNLSVCEIANCLNVLFSLLSFLFSSLTRTTYFLQGLSVTGRPLFQCLMCVERYLAVVHPVTFLKYKPLRYRVICCTAAWINTLGSCLFCMFSLISNNLHAYTWFYTLQFLLFLSIQLFCLVAVLRALKQSGPGERGRERGEENNMKRRAFHIILITTVSIAIIYLPYIIIGLSFVSSQLFMVELIAFSFICYIFAGFVQPILYFKRAGKLSCFCSP
ncbi:G-protein coupled receptor 35-like [Ctenopharyngodon idella]|uniref:G-protein coupled receptor 35-like n=1 Tax=Ctenopharyngodon idella TaxID=7959 RepID=UPI00222E7F40|nr:G-protein coupled receptor 35-like [Ctenopharyngodon idella]